MRWLAATLVLSCAWPLAARAQEGDAFEEAEQSLGVDRPVGTWRLDDGIGPEEVPWDDFDPSRGYFPRGGPHLGLELRVSALPLDTFTTSPRPQVELHVFTSIRYAGGSPWQLRLGIAVGWELHEQSYLGGGTIVTSSAFYVRLRVLPLSVDFGRNVGLRLGPDIGLQVAPSPGGGRVMVSAGGLAQLVGRTDDGRFEAGAHAGFQITGADRLGRPNAFDPTDDGTGQSYTVDPVVGLTAGYLF